jgi:regulator of sigma D
MLDNCKTSEERWLGVQALVNRWLDDRQELIVLYCSLSGVNALQASCKSSTDKIRQFCQLMMDYTSAGHFEVYDQLARATEDSSSRNHGPFQQLYPEIQLTTDAILRFNDLFDTDEHCAQALGQLKNELSLLGEQLVNRFALEDQLISILQSSRTNKSNG